MVLEVEMQNGDFILVIKRGYNPLASSFGNFSMPRVSYLPLPASGQIAQVITLGNAIISFLSHEVLMRWTLRKAWLSYFHISAVARL